METHPAQDSGRFKDAIIQAANAARSGGAHLGVRRANSTLDRTRVAMAAGGGVDRPGMSRAGSSTSQGITAGGGGGGGGVAMRAIYLTLLEVALALRHMHAKNLVHCDVS